MDDDYLAAAAENAAERSAVLAGRLAGSMRELDRVKAYHDGDHDAVYTPPDADQDFRQLADRCVTNLMPLAVKAVSQSLKVIGYRRGDADTPMDELPEWLAWKRNGYDSRQKAVLRTAVQYGVSFIAVLGREWKAFSPRRMAVEYADNVSGEVAEAFGVLRFPAGKTPGQAIYIDAEGWHAVSFKSLVDRKSFSASEPLPHGQDECPVAAIAPFRDLDGETPGVITPLIPVQNRLNQTVFDLLTGQTNSAFAVRWATGVFPDTVREEVLIDPEDPDEGTEWVDKLDADGRPMLKPIKLSARRILMNESPDAKFGSLPPAPLDGLLRSVEMAVEQLAALASVPSFYLGKIEGVSAKALNAADAALVRLVEDAQTAIAEHLEKVFRWSRRAEGVSDDLGDREFLSELGFADPRQRNEAELADAATKWVSAGVPKKGIWALFPNMTPALMAEWDKLAEEQRQDEPDDAFRRVRRDS